MARILLAAAAALWVSVAVAGPLPAWQNDVPGDTQRLGQALDTATGEWLSAEQLVTRLAAADRLMVGERHDNADHHQLQLWLLQQLHEQRPRASLLQEMLTPSQQEALDELQRGGRQLADDQLVDHLQWNPGWEWRFYGPIISWALDSGIHLQAANLDRDEISALYRHPGEVSPRYSASALRELRQTIETSHCGQIAEPQLTAMLGIQQQRDVRMAEALQSAPAPAVLLAGNYHARKDLGVALHMDEAAPVVLMLHEAGTPLPSAEQADYLWLTPAAPAVDHCAQWAGKRVTSETAAAPAARLSTSPAG
ncbi:ChaN family lipoprotein [Halopseudomonas pertucinogena]|uniref:Haem-binding uptake Tiki superfamily ChaN domain-containing protein n=1 Tax=Halopseudomonas pertucinogena TaxID=86175 RepID=A0ABQ2CJ05_9GAMM|nr:ChaN family lipoprotein [Halopseudomonas pertucinogena]GGI88072.1 hypothetical protein GCM10009083_00520 [Halopseudomonas pertucinogena]